MVSRKSTLWVPERAGIVMGFPMTHAGYHADNPFAIASTGASAMRDRTLGAQGTTSCSARC